MSMYAFKDKERIEKISANEALSNEYIGKRFYCPNPKCDAYMEINAKDGVHSAYFAAKRKGHKHIQGCGYYEKSNSFNPNDYKEKDFNFDEALLALTIQGNSKTNEGQSDKHNTGPAQPKVLHTLAEIYYMCKHYSCDQIYNGKVVGQMLVYDRSVHMYPKGVFGWRIIEGKCKSKFYDPEETEIYLDLNTQKVKYTFVLNFDNEKLFYNIKNKIFKNSKNIIIVAGEWRKSDTYNTFVTDILSDKQLKILK